MAGKVGGARPGAGRPKGSKNKVPGHVRELARDYTESAVKELATLAGATKGRKAKSEAARVMAIKELLDRAWGKSTQAHQHSGAVAVVTITAEKLNGLSEDELATLESALPVLQKLGLVGGDPAAEAEAGD